MAIQNVISCTIVFSNTCAWKQQELNKTEKQSKYGSYEEIAITERSKTSK